MTIENITMSSMQEGNSLTTKRNYATPRIVSLLDLEATSGGKGQVDPSELGQAKNPS